MNHLQYHQEHSKPILDALKISMQDQFKQQMPALISLYPPGGSREFLDNPQPAAETCIAARNHHVIDKTKVNKHEYPF